MANEYLRELAFRALSLFKQVIKSVKSIRFNKRFVKTTAWLALAFASCVLIFLGSIYFGLFGKIPSKGELSTINNHTASEIYSIDSVLLGKYYLQERTDITFKQLAPVVTQALLATEDIRFYNHNGVDTRSLLRVFIKSILLQDASSGGGSTITQQLAKNIFPRNHNGFLSTPINKIKEMIIAKRLEKLYSKDDLITLYFNTVSFGENAFGIKTAAERFFSKTPATLNIQEAAVLVGLLKATNTYNPRIHPQKSIKRRNLVIDQMEKYEFITPLQSDSIKLLPLNLRYRQSDQNSGIATYFRAIIRRRLNQWCKENKKEDGSNYNLYKDGLKIYTTIHSKLQAYAEAAVKAHMTDLQANFDAHWNGKKPWSKNRNTLLNAIRKSDHYKKLKAKGLSEKEIQEVFKQPRLMRIFTWKGEIETEMSPLDSVKHYLQFLQAGFLAMSPESGNILAWVGGIDHKYFKYDHVNLKTKRQVGSTFKPIVYATALEHGAKPCDFVAAKRVTYANYQDWSPANADGNYDGLYSVHGALTNSVNTVSVKVLRKGKIDRTIALAKAMGIESEIPEVPSIALGTANISLYEMVNAFATFANQGHAVEPNYLISINDKYGNELASFQSKTNNKQVLSRETTGLMIEMLKNVVNDGTAARIRSIYKLNNDIAGKTGTTQSHADGWFIGFTPNLVAGAWVGSDDPSIHFRTIKYGQGAAMALPIWAKFIQNINRDEGVNTLTQGRFPRPSERMQAKLDCVEYKEKNSILDDIFAKILKKRTRTPRKKKRSTKRRKRRRSN